MSHPPPTPGSGAQLGSGGSIGSALSTLCALESVVYPESFPTLRLIPFTRLSRATRCFAAGNPLGIQLFPCFQRTICFPEVFMNASDLNKQPPIQLRPATHRPCAPAIVTARTDLQRPAQLADLMVLAVFFNKSVLYLRSLAKVRLPLFLRCHALL